jgi:cytochrome c556
MKHSRICQRILFASVCLVAGVAFAAEPEDIIKYRQSVMKANGAHMAAAGAIIKDINSLFPKDSDFGETKALDAVWKNSADFQKRARDSAQKADALTKAVAAGDSKNYAARFKELSDSCKACHKDFRKEEK